MRDIVGWTWWAHIHSKWLTSPQKATAAKVLSYSDSFTELYQEDGAFVYRCADISDYVDLVDCGFDWDVVEEQDDVEA